MIKNVILLIVLVAQVCIWLLVSNPWKEEHEASSRAVTEHKLEAIDLDRIGAFKVTDSTGQSIRLSLRDDRWVIDDLQGFPAIQEKVTAALDELSGLERSDYRTSKRFLHTDLEVDDQKGQHLELFDRENRPLVHLVIGKRDIQGSKGTFVRRHDEDHVFVAPSQNLGTVFSTIQMQWYFPGMMDIPDRDQARMTELRSACFKIELEALVPEKDAEGRPVVPESLRAVRTVYERVVETDTEGKETIWWKVLEPEDKADIQCDDLLIKGLVGLLLNTRAQYVVGPGSLPEYGFDDPAKRMVHMVAWFKEKDQVTKRTLEIGVERGDKASGNGFDQPTSRYARVSHPGDRYKQSFVFLLPQHHHRYFQREADQYRRGSVPPPPRSR